MTNTSATTSLARIVFVLQARSPDKVVINKGAHDGVKLGDRYIIYGLGPDLSDPETNENLGKLEIVRGRGKVVHLQDRLATLLSTERQIERVASKKIIRESSIIAFGPRTIEEVVPESMEDMPFDDPEVGDFARPI